MATVDLNHVQFWEPPSKASLYKPHTISRNYSRTASATRSRDEPVPAARQRGYDSEAQPQDEILEAQVRNHEPASYGSDADDGLPSLEEILGQPLRKEIALKRSQGTRDMPVILEDDERDTPDLTTDSEATSISGNAGPVPVFELNTPANPYDREAWWDVEDGCFVYEDLPPLDHQGVTSTPAHDQVSSDCQSHGVSQEEAGPRSDNRSTQDTLEESAVQSLPTTLDKDGAGENEGNADLERGLELVLEGQEELSATPPTGLRSSRSASLLLPPIDQDRNLGWSEGLQSCSRVGSQGEEKEGQREQEQGEMAVDRELGEPNDNDDNGEREQPEGKRHHQNDVIRSGIRQFESSGRGHDTDEDDEEDKNPRPTKRRRLFLTSPHVPEPLNDDGDGDGDDNASDLEGNLLLAFEGQEKSASAAATSSLGHRHPTVLLQTKGNTTLWTQIACSEIEEPQDVSQVRISDECQGNSVAHKGVDGEGDKDITEWREVRRQQHLGEGSELEGEDEEPEELAMEECLHNAEEEDGSDNPEDEDYECISIDEEDEDIRPAKRQRLPSRLSDEGFEDRSQQSSKSNVTRPHRSSSTATKRGHARPKTMRNHARDSTVHEPLHTPHPSRSPSDIDRSELAAVYREWPLHGFLKSTRIGNNTTFNLEFHLVGVPEHLEVSAPFIKCRNNDQSSLQPRVPSSTIAHPKTHNRQPMPPRQRAPWTTQEDSTLVKMKEDENCSWKEISAALSSHSRGSIQVRYSTKFSKRSRAGNQVEEASRAVD